MLVVPLAIGCHAIDRGAAARGDTVLVIGAGPIGLSAVGSCTLGSRRPNSGFPMRR